MLPFPIPKQLLRVALGFPLLAGGAAANSQTYSAPQTLEAYYAIRSSPIWFIDSAPTSAASAMPAILRRSELDGFVDGPSLAAEVENAIQSARRTPASAMQSDHVISNAWIRYVQALQAPMPGVEYADERLPPKVETATRILARAAANQSRLLEHVQRVSAVNPLYSVLRETVWQETLRSAGILSPITLANLARVRFPAPDGKFTIVDARAAMLYMFENGQLVDSMRVVVGKPATPTPLIVSTIYYATLNPYWHVPENLIHTVAARVASQGPSYLKKQNYQIVSKYGPDAIELSASSINWKTAASGTTKLFIRQLPGRYNSMGRMKFAFDNAAAIYLHDTPNKAAFSNLNRLLSNGCIRLENAPKFGRWLLGQTPQSSTNEPDENVLLSEGVPILVTYLTVSADQGSLKLLSDPYRLDIASSQSDVAAR